MSPVLAAAPAVAEISRLSMYLPPLLVVLVGMCMLLRELRLSRPVEEPLPLAPPAPEVEAEVPLAVIAAAVAAAVGRPHRLVSVDLAPRQLAWSIEGRRQLLTSHQIRR